MWKVRTDQNLLLTKASAIPAYKLVFRLELGVPDGSIQTHSCLELPQYSSVFADPIYWSIERIRAKPKLTLETPSLPLNQSDCRDS